jgi:soluble P-type ATPase
MIKLKIPENEELEIQHLVLDFNGTLAIDGTLLPGVKDLLTELSAVVNIHVLTADTFGMSETELTDIDCLIVIFEKNDQQKRKLSYIQELGAEHCATIGNGSNDAMMLRASALGIALIQKEGAASETLMSAKIVCHDIIHALELLLHPKRIYATLRK